MGECLSRRQLAARWNVSVRFIDKLLAERRLAAYHVGRRVLIRIEDAEALLVAGRLA